jgi:hypothetical protein
MGKDLRCKDRMRFVHIYMQTSSNPTALTICLQHNNIQLKQPILVLSTKKTTKIIPFNVPITFNNTKAFQ